MNGETRENGTFVHGSVESPPAGEPRANGSQHVIDVELRKDSTYGIATALATIFGLIVSIGVTTAGVELGLLNHSVSRIGVCLGMILLFQFLVFRAVRRHVHDRVKSLCDMNADRSTEELVRIIVEDFGRPGTSVLAEALAQVLSEVREPGFVIRCCPPDLRSVIRPVAFPFEPLVLDEADDATAAFRHALDSCDGHESAGQTLADVQEPESRFAREIRRRNRLAGLPRWSVGFFAVVIAIYLLATIMSGEPYFAAMIFGILILLFFAGPFLSGVFSFQDCWLVVPGGLLVRGGGWRRGGVSLHRYERSQAVLVVLRSKGTVWLAAVSDGRSLHFKGITRDEVSLLLRCWLSPLRPLPIDRYSDFAGSA